MLAFPANFTAYDACYIALAELVAGALLTADERLSRAVGEHTAIVCFRDEQPPEAVTSRN
ncbi:MAG: hypothetical protein WD271_02130 [Acidimicrobiia bacterium]